MVASLEIQSDSVLSIGTRITLDDLIKLAAGAQPDLLKIDTFTHQPLTFDEFLCLVKRRLSRMLQEFLGWRSYGTMNWVAKFLADHPWLPYERIFHFEVVIGSVAHCFLHAHEQVGQE